MGRPAKRLKTSKNQKTRIPLVDESLKFDDDEPLGEECLSNQPDESISADLPPLDTGKNSTKPTPFDRLPWKSVKLPEFIADGLAFEADGGMLGLEELDGSVWEEYQVKSRSTLKKKNSEDPVHQLGTASNSPIPIHRGSALKTGAMSDKLVRKQAKRDRLAALRLAKRSQRQAPQLKSESPQKNLIQSNLISSEDLNQNDTSGVDWAAAGKINGFSDMQEEDERWLSQQFDESILPDWAPISLAPPLKRALYSLSFTKPTAVQDTSLRLSLASHRDLVVIAETGSGKTLAFGLPIINALITSTSAVREEEAQHLPITALILTPTRELCLQVKQHLDTFLSAMSKPPDANQASAQLGKPQPLRNRSGISVVSVCGGIAIAKQRKQLERSKKLMEPGRGGRGCIVVGTPGRLWDLIQSWDAMAQGIRHNLDWLVVDEADRMIEKGHFEEIEKILKLTKRNREGPATDDWSNTQDYVKEDIRTMVFSATMDKNLQINLKKNRRKLNRDSEGDPMKDLLEQIDFRDPNPEFIDLTPKGLMVGGLKECKIECVQKDKDLYLFHFLLRYTGRTIVFLSSISALRRLSPILTLLFPNSTVLSLHSEMQQRSRLKSLDKFKSTPKSILLSTDVAARGLDIPLVDHVIHYQVPRTVDCYVHRSGRTARAGREGVAMVLIGPDEIKVWRGLMKSLNRTDNLPSPPVEHSISTRLRELIELAKQIDLVEHRSSKQVHEENWMKKTAEDMEIDLEGSQDDTELNTRVSQLKSSKSKSQKLREDLSKRLKEAIILKGAVVKRTRSEKRSSCFITDPQVMERLLNGQSHERLIGLDNNLDALKELGSSKPKSTQD